MVPKRSVCPRATAASCSRRSLHHRQQVACTARAATDRTRRSSAGALHRGRAANIARRRLNSFVPAVLQSPVLRLLACQRSSRSRASRSSSSISRQMLPRVSPSPANPRAILGRRGGRRPSLAACVSSSHPSSTLIASASTCLLNSAAAGSDHHSVGDQASAESGQKAGPAITAFGPL